MHSYAMLLRLSFLIGLVSIILPSPCHAGWIADADGKTIVHLVLYDLPDPSVPGSAQQEAEYAVIQAFERRFPMIMQQKYVNKYMQSPEKYGNHNWNQVEIELHRFSGIKIEGVQMDSGPLMAIAGGVSPDILYVNFRQSDTYIQNGFLYPLDKEEDNYFSALPPDEQKLYIHPKIQPVVMRKGPENKTHVWAIPRGGVMGKVIIFRKDLLENAGVAFPDNDWTWNDFYEACRKIADPANGIYGTWFVNSKHESNQWMSFLWSAGGTAMEYSHETDSWTASFDSPEAALALDFYTRLCTEPWTDRNGRKQFGYAYNDIDGKYKWQQGQIGFISTYIDENFFSTINPDQVGMVPVPIGPTGIRAAEINSRMQGIFAGIDNPVIRDTAWEYIRFIESRESLEIRTRKMVQGGLGQFVNPQNLRMFGYEDLIRLAPRGWEEIFNIAIGTGQPEPYGKNCQLIYDIITKPIQNARNLAFDNKLPSDPQERLQSLRRLLKDGVDEANEKMIGIIPEDKLVRRRSVAACVLAVIAVAFSLLLIRITRLFTPKGSVYRGRQISWGFIRYRWAYVLLMPAVLSVLFWQYFPLCMGTKMAFQDYRIMGGSEWVGIDNFANVLFDTDWWLTVWNSIRYSILVISLTFLPPVILAVLLQEIPKGKILFRTLFYLPAVITGLVVIYLWKSFYEPTEYGVLNSIVMRIPAAGHILVGAGFLVILLFFAKRLYVHGSRITAFVCIIAGIMLFVSCFRLALPIITAAPLPWYKALFAKPDTAYRWLLNPDTAMLCCVLPMVWAGMGPGCLIYLAALKGIPNDHYEAADIDGATFIDKILFVVIPTLKPLLIINFVGIFIGAWKNSAYILAMTGGSSATETAGLHIFYKAYMYQKFSPATAMAWLLGFILIGFTIYQLQILARLEYRTTGNEEL